APALELGARVARLDLAADGPRRGGARVARPRGRPAAPLDPGLEGAGGAGAVALRRGARGPRRVAQARPQRVRVRPARRGAPRAVAPARGGARPRPRRAARSSQRPGVLRARAGAGGPAQAQGRVRERGARAEHHARPRRSRDAARGAAAPRGGRVKARARTPKSLRPKRRRLLANVLVPRAMELARRRKPREAAAVAERMIRLEPLCSWAYFYRAGLSAARGDAAGVVADLTAMKDIPPEWLFMCRDMQVPPPALYPRTVETL